MQVIGNVLYNLNENLMFFTILTKMVCHRWNVDRTYDVTPQRDVQFCRSELDAMLEPTVTWEPYTDTVSRVYLQYAQQELIYGVPVRLLFVWRMLRCMFEIGYFDNLG